MILPINLCKHEFHILEELQKWGATEPPPLKMKFVYLQNSYHVDMDLDYKDLGLELLHLLWAHTH